MNISILLIFSVPCSRTATFFALFAPPTLLERGVGSNAKKNSFPMLGLSPITYFSGDHKQHHPPSSTLVPSVNEQCYYRHQTYFYLVLHPRHAQYLSALRSYPVNFFLHPIQTGSVFNQSNIMLPHDHDIPHHHYSLH